MNDVPQPPPDPAAQRRREIYDEVRRHLHEALPPQPADTAETPEHVRATLRSRYERAALAEVAAMDPANHLEASYAVHCVLTREHGEHCLRLAEQHAADPKFSRQLCNQAASMEREARAHHKMLLKVQAVRRKRQADPVTREQDARTEQTVLRYLTEALERIQAEEAAAAAAAVPEPARHAPSPLFARPLNLRLWEAHLHAGPPLPIDRTIH